MTATSTGTGDSAEGADPGRDAQDAVSPDALIATHVSLVAEVVHRVTARFPSFVDRDDLRGAGWVGLVDAAHRYDATTGVPFARYAAIRIRGSVLDASRSRDWAPRRVRRDLRAIDHATSTLEHQLQRQPSEEEVADEAGMSTEAVRDRLAAEMRSSLLALDGPDLETAEATALADRLVEQDPAWVPEAAFEQAEMNETLQTAVEQLPDPLRHVLVEHHVEGRLLGDIAREIGCTEARISQLGIEAMHALQAYFATLYTGVSAVPPSAPGSRRRAQFVAKARSTRRAEAQCERPDAEPFTESAGRAGRRPAGGGGARP